MNYEGSFKSPDGLGLYERGWEPDGPARGHVVFVHGYGEHCSRYVEVGRVLNRAGFSMHTYDQRGFGRSPGKRGHVDDFDLLLKDLDAFLTHIRPRISGAPWFLMGHSMGGLVVASYAETRILDARGLVFSSPFLAMNAPAVLVMIAGVLGVLTPWMPVAWVNHAARSRDPKVVEEASKDPLIFPGPVRARTGSVFNQAIQRARANFHRITAPAYIIHGTGDQIVPDIGSRLLHERCGSEDKTFTSYDGGYHELWNDLDKEAVLAGISNWMTAHL